MTQGAKRADASTSSPPKRQKQSPTPKGKGRGRGSQAQSPASESDIVKAMAKLVLRHEDSLNSVLSNMAYVSFMRTEDHSIVHILASSAQDWKQDQSLADSLRMHMTSTLFQT